MFETAPFAAIPTVRPERDQVVGASSGCGRAPPCRRRVSVVIVERREDPGFVAGRSSAPDSASMCRVTPPG